MRKPIQAPLPQYQPLDGVLSPISIRELRGLNTYDPYSIADSFFTEMSNMTVNDYPAVSVRPGYTSLGTIGTRVLGLGVWRGQELHAVFNDGTWRRWNGSSWATLVSGLSTTAEWTFTNFDGNLGGINLVGMNGVDSPRKYNGSTVSVLAGAPTNGKYITTYQNRLWCAVGNELWSCALDQPEAWATFAGNQQDSYRKTIESSHGEEINMLSGSLYRLTIGMPSSIHLLMGSVPSDFNSRIVTDDEGVVNNNAVAVQEGVMRFMHKTGLYEYAASTVPDKTFSALVRAFYSSVSVASAAGSDGRKLYFATQAGEVLVNDPSLGAWERWNIPVVRCFAQVGQDLYIGTDDGRVLKLGGTTDAGAAIVWSAVTKPFTLEAISRKQRWLKMFVVAEVPTGSTMRISLSRLPSGDSDWQLMKTVVGGSGSVQRIIIPVDKFALEHTVRIKIDGTGWMRVHEITRQVRQLPLY